MNSWLKTDSTSILLFNMVRALECFNSSLLPFSCHVITFHYLIISFLNFPPKLVFIIITICAIVLCFSYPIILILNFIAIKYPGLLIICFLCQIICSYSKHSLYHYFSFWAIFSLYLTLLWMSPQTELISKKCTKLLFLIWAKINLGIAFFKSQWMFENTS